jgi:hypothetical protein
LTASSVSNTALVPFAVRAADASAKSARVSGLAKARVFIAHHRSLWNASARRRASRRRCRLGEPELDSSASSSASPFSSSSVARHDLICRRRRHGIVTSWPARLVGSTALSLADVDDGREWSTRRCLGGE